MSAGFEVTDPRQLDREVRPMTEKVAQGILNEAQSATPRLSGTLANGWRLEGGEGVGWVVSNDVDYGVFVEFGSVHNPQPAAMLGRAMARARATYGH